MKKVSILVFLVSFLCTDIHAMLPRALRLTMEAAGMAVAARYVMDAQSAQIQEIAYCEDNFLENSIINGSVPIKTSVGGAVTGFLVGATTTHALALSTLDCKGNHPYIRTCISLCGGLAGGFFGARLENSYEIAGLAIAGLGFYGMQKMLSSRAEQHAAELLMRERTMNEQLNENIRLRALYDDLKHQYAQKEQRLLEEQQDIFSATDACRAQLIKSEEDLVKICETSQAEQRDVTESYRSLCTLILAAQDEIVAEQKETFETLQKALQENIKDLEKEIIQKEAEKDESYNRLQHQLHIKKDELSTLKHEYEQSKQDHAEQCASHNKKIKEQEALLQEQHVKVTALSKEVEAVKMDLTSCNRERADLENTVELRTDELQTCMSDLKKAQVLARKNKAFIDAHEGKYKRLESILHEERLLALHEKALRAEFEEELLVFAQENESLFKTSQQLKEALQDVKTHIVESEKKQKMYQAHIQDLTEQLSESHQVAFSAQKEYVEKIEALQALLLVEQESSDPRVSSQLVRQLPRNGFISVSRIPQRISSVSVSPQSDDSSSQGSSVNSID